MYKYYDALLNRSGDALAGYFIRLFDAVGNQVPIYADESETPIITESGIANAAKSDDDGMVRFFVDSGDYDIRLYDASDTFVATERAVPMVRGITDSDLAAPSTAAGIGEANEGNVQAALDTATADIAARPTTAALASSSGGEMVGFKQSGAGSVVRNASDKFKDMVNVLDYIPVEEHAAILAGTSTYDASADVQAAIDDVNSLRGGTLIVRGAPLLVSSVNLDRPVDTTSGDLTIMGIGNGAGFRCTSAMTMFSSTIPHTSGPVTERVIFSGLVFACNSAATAAYVLSEKFLRVEFSACRFERIKCNNSDIYMQSWRWVNCNVWRWNGSFSKTDEQAYDCHASMTKFEGATVGGDAFDWKLPQGCSVHQGMFEGSTGCHIRATSCNGFSAAGNYTENGNATNPDYIFALQSAGGISKGVSFTGNHINTQNTDVNFYPVILGKASGVGGGNYSNRNLYDDTNVKTGDFMSCGDNVGLRLQKGNISLAALPSGIKTRSTGLVAHAGGGQTDATLLASQVNVIGTVATAADSVILPGITGDSAKCLEVYVLNNGANAANVYPPLGQNFEFAASNAPKSLAGSGASKIYRYLGGGVWTQA